MTDTVLLESTRASVRYITLNRPARKNALTDELGWAILEAFGLPIPEDLAGQSFLDELRGGGRGLERGPVSAFMEHWRTLNVGKWKLVERPGRAPALYDLDRDPDETDDLADGRPIVRRWLRGLLGIRLAESADDGTPERRRRPRAERTVIDDETAAQLRALGYTGD